jgi:hypothetical protein
VTRIVTLQFEGFVRTTLDRLPGRARGSRRLGVRTAILYYLRNREEGRPGWRAPRFGGTPKDVRGERVTVDDKTWAELEEEAGRQGVTPGMLAEHAVLFYLADLESGRIAERLDAAMDEPDEVD